MVTCFVSFLMLSIQQNLLRSENVRLSICPERHKDLLADFTLPDKPTFSDVRKIVDFLLRSYDDGTIDTIEVLFTSFINTLRQEPELVRLFPLNGLDEMNEKLHQRFGVLEHEVPKDNREIIIEDRNIMLSELASLYLKQEVFQLILESQASEHSRCMVAMKTATDNAGNLIDDLTLQYNRARQAAITQEILEISAASFPNNLFTLLKPWKTKILKTEKSFKSLELLWTPSSQKVQLPKSMML